MAKKYSRALKFMATEKQLEMIDWLRNEKGLSEAGAVRLMLDATVINTGHAVINIDGFSSSLLQAAFERIPEATSIGAVQDCLGLTLTVEVKDNVVDYRTSFRGIQGYGVPLSTVIDAIVTCIRTLLNLDPIKVTGGMEFE